MANRMINSVKLGVFVLAGLAIMIFSLYMIGRDTNMFGSNYILKVRFDNVHGLTSGNNIRFAGIQVGTVKKVKILSDTLVEVSMLIDTKMEKYIHKNDIVSMSTDGLMGNRILNITPARDGAPLAEDGDILVAKKSINTEEMMETLDRTNRNIAQVSEELKTTVSRINDSRALWDLLGDQGLPASLKASISSIRRTAEGADQMVRDLKELVSDVKDGKGSLGKVLTDTSIAYNLEQAVIKIQDVGEEAGRLADDLSKMIKGIDADLRQGRGTAHALLKDTLMAYRLNESLSNIEKGTAAFNQNMEALKHNFLLRGYFKRLEKRQRSEKGTRAY